MRANVLDLFSAAAGGWSLGMHRAGYRTMAACEAVDWRRALYAQNNPGVRIYDDVCTLTATRLLGDFGFLPDIVVGSPPCQDISSANTKGKGVDGKRSGLYFEAIRIIGECRPRWFTLENSANLRTRGADRVKAALEALGYTCWFFVVGADDAGANHERKRSWLIGCDLDQVADADGIGWHEGRSRGRGGFDLSVSSDHLDAASLGHEGGRAWRHGSDGNGAAYAGDPSKDGCGSGVPGRCARAAGRPEQSPRRYVAHAGDAESAGWDALGGWRWRTEGPSGVWIARRDGGTDADGGRGSVCEHGIRWPWQCHECGEAADAASERHGTRPGDDQSPRREADRDGLEDVPASVRTGRNTPDPDQAGQADGCMVSDIRQEEIADDGCGDGRRADGSGERQMGVCPPDRSGADECGSLWSLDDLAGRLRLDDGLPARVAGTRVAVGGPKGTVAASLIVEAYGDAVIPQIPEAIGRAIWRVEAALAAIYQRAAA